MLIGLTDFWVSAIILSSPSVLFAQRSIGQRFETCTMFLKPAGPADQRVRQYKEIELQIVEVHSRPCSELGRYMHLSSVDAIVPLLQRILPKNCSTKWRALLSPVQKQRADGMLIGQQNGRRITSVPGPSCATQARHRGGTHVETLPSLQQQHEKNKDEARVSHHPRRNNNSSIRTTKCSCCRSPLPLNFGCDRLPA